MPTAMETYCAMPVLCTIDRESLVSVKSKHSVEHKTNTNVSTSFMGHTIILHKTDRLFSLDMTMETVSPSCDFPEYRWFFEGQVTEHCSHESAQLYYTNIKEGVCLYRKLTSNISFSASPESERVLFKVEQGYTSHGYFMPVVSSWAEEEWVLVKNGSAETLYTQNIPGGYDGVKIGIVAPTPDPFYAAYDKQLNSALTELNEINIYNLYEPCRDGGPAGNSRTALDGTESGDMFFPEWCRERVDDPMWEQAALDMYLQCSQNFLGWEPYIQSAGAGYTTPLNHSALPVGDFARHPDHGEMYSFLLSSDRSAPKVVNSFTRGVPEELLVKALKAAGIDISPEADMLFFPISLY